MTGQKDTRILTLNSGSSSLKFAVFQLGSTETQVLSGSLERIAQHDGLFAAKAADGAEIHREQLPLPDHAAAINTLFAWLHNQKTAADLDAVGHRVVHGGSEYTEPKRITPDLVTALEKLIPLAPEHLPHEIKAIKAVDQAYPGLTQVACFDTAFHRTMPRLAQIYPLPRQWEHAGLRRYGFHGLSYEFIIGELRLLTGEQEADGRVIVAHLGNGASMAAVRQGKCVDTTMGFTPTGGLVMSTRSGDLDPGVLLYLLREKGLTPSALNDLVNRQAGLLGVSGESSDVKDLLARESVSGNAAEALGLFCYQAKKFLASLAGVLGGLDTLIFTGGIGEHAPSIRARICHDLGFLGVHIDPSRNNRNAPIISRDGNPVTVRVMKTNEERIVARHTKTCVQDRQSASRAP